MYHSPDWVLPHMEKAAPIMGPNRNPRLKATPIRAIPFPLLAGVDTSVTIAVDRLTLPKILSLTCHYSLQEQTFRYSSYDPGKHEDREVAGEDPEEVGDGDTNGGGNH